LRIRQILSESGQLLRGRPGSTQASGKCIFH
jgi:hypothetical protein